MQRQAMDTGFWDDLEEEYQSVPSSEFKSKPSVIGSFYAYEGDDSGDDFEHYRIEPQIFSFNNPEYERSRAELAAEYQTPPAIPAPAKVKSARRGIGRREMACINQNNVISNSSEKNPTPPAPTKATPRNAASDAENAKKIRDVFKMFAQAGVTFLEERNNLSEEQKKELSHIKRSLGN